MTAGSRRELLVWGASILVLVAVTLLLYRFRSYVDQVHVALVYLLLVLGGSAITGRALGMTLACVSFLLINYFFQRPYDLMTVSGIGDWAVLVAFLCTAAVTTHLLARARAAAERADLRADEVALLARLGSEALSAGTAEEALNAVTHLIGSSLQASECTIEPPDADHLPLIGVEYSADKRTMRIPLVAHNRVVGMLRVHNDLALALDAAQQRFLDALSDYAALAAERVRLVAAAEHAEALREADRLKDVLLASVSHDLRTPLTTIKALAQASARGGDPNATVIAEQADRLGRLVNDLVDLSCLKGGAFHVEMETNSAEDLIGAVLRQVAGLRGHPVIRTVIDRDAPAIYGQFDFVQSVRVLTNLLENAARFSPPGEPIEVRVQRDGSGVRFTVSDRGPGVPPDERDRIFEPFYRGQRAKDDGRGSGLGLSIARHLAELQRGSVAFFPRPGGGSEFVFTLAAADPRLADTSEPPTS